MAQTRHSLPRVFFACGLLCLAGFESLHAQTWNLREAPRRPAISVEVGGTGTGACFGQCMGVRVVNRSAVAYTVVCERGTVLVARNSAHQNMVIAHETAVSVAGRSQQTDLVWVLCMNMDKLPPQNCTYDVAEHLADTRVLRVLEEIDRRNLYGNEAGQYAIWPVTEDRRRNEVIAATSGDPNQKQRAAEEAEDVLRAALGPEDADRFARSVPLPTPAIGGLTRELTMYVTPWYVLAGGGLLLIVLVLVLATRRGNRPAPTTPRHAAEPPAAEAGAAVTAVSTPARPGGVTLLGVLYILGGIGSALLGVATAAILFRLLPVKADLPPSLLMVGVPGLLGVGVAALVSIAIGVGLLRLRRWARAIVLVFGTLGILGSAYSTVMAMSAGMPPVYPLASGVLALVIVLYLCSAKVKQAFA